MLKKGNYPNFSSSSGMGYAGSEWQTGNCPFAWIFDCSFPFKHKSKRAHEYDRRGRASFRTSDVNVRSTMPWKLMTVATTRTSHVSSFEQSKIGQCVTYTHASCDRCVYALHRWLDQEGEILLFWTSLYVGICMRGRKNNIFPQSSSIIGSKIDENLYNDHHNSLYL